MFWSYVARVLAACFSRDVCASPTNAPERATSVYALSAVGARRDGVHLARACSCAGKLLDRRRCIGSTSSTRSASAPRSARARTCRHDLRAAGYLSVDLRDVHRVHARADRAEQRPAHAVVSTLDIRADASRPRSLLAIYGHRIAPGPVFFSARRCSRRVAVVLAAVRLARSSTACAARSARRSSSASTRSTSKIGEGGMGAVYRAHHVHAAPADRGQAAAARRVGADDARALRARGAAHEPADPPEHRRRLRLRPQPRRRLLLRDGVPRRRHRPREPRPRARPAAERPRRADPRAGVRRAAAKRTTQASSTATSSRRTSCCASAAACPTS